MTAAEELLGFIHYFWLHLFFQVFLGGGGEGGGWLSELPFIPWVRCLALVITVESELECSLLVFVSFA